MSKHDTSEGENCRVCLDCSHSKENKKPCKRLKWKFSMKWWVFTLIALFCVSGLIGPFAAQFASNSDSVHYTMLNAWNMYVGIILGVVATLLSIVSLVFSFHNEEEENIQQRNSDAQFEALKTSVIKLEKDLNTTSKTMADMNKAIESMDRKMSIYFESSKRNTTTAESKTNGEEINNEVVD